MITIIKIKAKIIISINEFTWYIIIWSMEKPNEIKRFNLKIKSNTKKKIINVNGKIGCN